MRPALVVVVAAVLLLGASTARSAPGPPNDPAWPTEWGPVLTHTDDVWRQGTGSRAVVIAVVDTGVAPVADLDGALVEGVDLLGGGVSQGGPTAYGYHGTWVASIIGARGDNGRDTAGYCWQCSIMPVRVADGTTPVDGARVAQGIRWAVDHGARIVNVSLAGSEPSIDEEAAVAYAAAHDVIVVASAGNDSDAAARYPGAYPSVLAVAATDRQDRLYPWATRGSWIELAAPGCATVVDPNGVAYGCGSSFAPAAVSGIAGLLLSFDPLLTGAQVTTALKSSAHAVEGIGGGRVDAAAAFAALPLPHTTNVPSPVSPAPATAAAPLEVSVLHGTLTASRSVTFRAGTGRIVIRLFVRPGLRCSLLLRLGDSAVFAMGGSGIVSGDVSTPGAKRVTISCPTTRHVEFALEIERTAALP